MASAAQERPRLSLTDRGRIVAILTQLDQRWDTLHCWDQARVRILLDELARTLRSQQVRASDWG